MFGFLSGHLLEHSCSHYWPFVPIVFCLFVIMLLQLVAAWLPLVSFSYEN